VTAARAPASRVVLVHGAWHGAWCWERVVPLLAERGLQATCIDLPGHGADSGSLGDLHADAAAVRAVLDAAPGPVVLVGHSYGGAVITEAAAGCRALADLVYLAAFMIDDSESVVGVSAGPASAATAELGARALRVAPDGVTTTIDPGLAAELFSAAGTPADAAAAAARLGPQLISTLTQCPRGVGWREHPATYVVCGDDRCVAPELQRQLAGRAGAVVELAGSSHSPFLSRPAEVAELIAAVSAP
jgi:pimeloyl-ACP methyl ester carboxylesterase